MDPIIGQLMLFAGNFAPKGWALCNGQLLPISQNTALFSILGTTFGGDGKTTFALPDLRGRAPIHFGQGPGLANYTEGAHGGTENITLGVANLPAHNHSLGASQQVGSSSSPEGSILATVAGPATLGPYVHATPNTAFSPAAIGNTGGGQPIDNRSPYLVMNWCIALNGIFPSRS